ncbi:MAG: helix-turn-helix domain-containing protein [bacterium]
MTNDTQSHIFEAAKQIFALKGYDGLSMRTLAKSANISLSVIYHYYSDKDVLLKDIFDTTNTKLGRMRHLMPAATSMTQALDQQLNFQLDHMEDVVFVMKYYFHFRDDFKKNATGFVPVKTSLHIEEILELGRSTNELRDDIDIVREAKVITHAINGYLLEIYPAIPQVRERARVIKDLKDFILRSITADRPVVPMR